MAQNGAERRDENGALPAAPFATRPQIHTVLQRVDELLRRGETEVESALTELNVVSATSVTGAQYAGITVIDDGGKLTSLAATHAYPVRLDEIQREHSEGPCLSAAWNQQVIVIDDLTEEMRWPAYRDAALQATPIRSVMSFRLVEEGAALAALNFYAETPAVFTDESVELGAVFAAHTSMAWHMLRREDHFRSALASRDLIGQAKGVLMERFDINAVAAFELLRTVSQENNIKLTAVAKLLVADDQRNRTRDSR